MLRRLSTLCLACTLSTLAAGAPAVGEDVPPKANQGNQGPARAIEPWADPGLKVTRGLALWIDAGRLNAARKTQGQAEVSDGARVDTWYDGSGHGRHLTQP